MPVDPTKLAALLALVEAGKPAVCGYWKVIWDAADSNETRYYSDAPYNQMAPFGRVGVPIDGRLKHNIFRDVSFEIDPDLRTETVPVIFDDIDKEIRGRFADYGSGVRCELYFYWPGADLTYLAWSGQLQAPAINGWTTLQCVATNGFRSPETLLPSRNKRKECGRRVFGAKLPNDEAREMSLCHYGLTGVGVPGFDDCPGLSTFDCDQRFGTTGGPFFGGFVIDGNAAVQDYNTGITAVSKGNASALKVPVRVIAGKVHVKGAQLLLWLRQPGNNPGDGFVLTLWEAGEGPVQSISSVQVNDLLTNHNNLAIRLGQRGQAAAGWYPGFPNFSHTAVIRADYGRVNPMNFSPSNLSIQFDSEGFNEVHVYSDEETFLKIWTDNRPWWMFESYANQKWGMGYDLAEFNIAKWITVANWSDINVSHTVNYADGESRTYTSRRSAFNAVMEPRRADQQIEDMARAGAVSVPYRHDGLITLSAFRAATEEELEDAPVFTDVGPSRSIIRDADNVPMITLGWTPDDQVVNTVEVRFEEASNKGSERPITFFDDDQKLLAGRARGAEGYYLEFKQSYAGFGLVTEAEAVRMARRILWFGAFDGGGIHNNRNATIICDFERTLALERYQIIKLQTELLDGIVIGLQEAYQEPLQYFRILSMQKIGNGLAQIFGQAYNHTAYQLFETEVGGSTISGLPAVVMFAGSDVVNDTYEYASQFNSKPSYRIGTKEIYWSSSKWRMLVDGVQYYESPNNVAYPWLAGWSETSPDGQSPAPIVFEGFMPDAGVNPVTIDPPDYNPTTGVLEIQVN